MTLVFSLLFFTDIPLGIAFIVVTGFSRGDKNAGTVVNSHDLHSSMNRERETKGESAIPSIDSVQGASSNHLARRDHSWSNVPDFFIKMIRKKDKQ